MSEVTGSSGYIELLNYIETQREPYSVVRGRIASMYCFGEITRNEYCQLLEKSKKIKQVQTEEEKEGAIYGALTDKIIELERRVKALENGQPDPQEYMGESVDFPIEAHHNMLYIKGKFYFDPEDNYIYECIRDSDILSGSGVALYFLPHELKDIYFKQIEENPQQSLFQNESKEE